MLKITVPSAQFWNENLEKFEYTKETTLVLEHSLISLSKWEAKFHKPYFQQAQKTDAEARYYIKCMTINDVKDDRVYYALTDDNVNAIYDYIHDPMTATVIKDDASNDKKKKKRKVPKDKREITSELVYYWMIQYNIPHEYERWHFERLLTLIRLCDEENRKAQEKEKKKKEKPRTTTQQLDAMAALNERRKAALHTKG